MLFDNTRLISALKKGDVVVMPTDTVYGICTLAGSQESVNKLYALKKRNKKPGTIIASSIDQLVDLGIKRRYLTAVEHLWPGALSIVVPTGLSLPYIDQGLGSVAVRITSNKELRDLLEKTGPLLTTSANLPEQEPASTIEEAKKYFGNSIELYVDGGDLSGAEASTVIRVVDDAIEVLRPGAVKIDEEGRIS